MIEFLKNLVRKPWFVHLIVLTALFVRIFFSASNFAHFNLDDYELIVNNPSIRDLGRIGDVLSSGRPVRGLTYMLDYQLFKLDPFGYHLVNYIWHWLGICCLYFLVYRLFGSLMMSGLTAALFFFHPVHSEALMAIAHRKEMLAFTFLLLAYHSFLYWRKYPFASFGFALLFFVLGIGSKQVVLIFPLLVLAHLWLDPSRRGSLKPIMFTALLIVLGAVVLVLGTKWSAPVLRDFNLFGRVSAVDFKELDYATILATSFSSYHLHIKYLFFPVHMNIVHEISLTTWGDPYVWLGVLLFLGLGASIYLNRHRFWVAFALGWIFLNLLPLMNWIPANYFFAERYLYIPSAGVCILIAGIATVIFKSRKELFPERHRPVVIFSFLFLLLAQLLLQTLSARFRSLWPPVLGRQMSPYEAILIAICVVALAGTIIYFAFSRSRLNKAAEKRWWLELVFSYLFILVLFIALFMLVEYLVQDRFGLPQKDINQGLNINKTWLSEHALNGPGPRKGESLLFPSGNAGTEILNFFIFVVGFPTIVWFITMRWAGKHAKAHFNRKLAIYAIAVIGMAYVNSYVLRVGEWSSELRLWSQAVREEPGSALAWNNLAKAHFDRKKYGRAEKAYRKAIELDSGKAENYRNLGVVLLRQNKFDEATRAFEEALQRRSGDLTSRKNLANIYITRALNDEDPAGYKKAVSHYLKIVEMDPRSAHAHYNLAFCYYKLDDLDRAMRHIMQSLRIDPQDRDSRALQQKIIEARQNKGAEKDKGR